MNTDKLKNRLKSIKTELNTDNQKILFRHSFEFQNDFKPVLNNIIDEKYFMYMSFPEDKNTYIGFEVAVIISNHNQIQQFKIKTNEKIKKINVFGGMAFDIKNKSFFPWEKIPKSFFYIPKILFKNNTIIYSKLIEGEFSCKEILEDIKRCLSKIEGDSNHKKHKTKIIRKEIIPTREKYLKNIETAKTQINDNLIKKVVISRIEKQTYSECPDIPETIEKINKEYPDCFNFIMRFHEKCYFIGSTPEKIIEKCDNIISTDALAGTAEKFNNLNNDKDKNEHNYVIEHLIEKLRDISERLEKSEIKTLKLNYAHHLLTQINGTSNHHIVDILHRIFPTPALCGTPTEKAMDIINSIESFDRGWYGGVMGNYDQHGNGNFYVPIRSALVNRNEIFLYSGSGIVKESESEKEWDETELKLKHLKTILE